MKKNELHNVLSQHCSFAVKYYTYKHDKLPTIKTFKIRIDTKALVKKLSETYSENEYSIIHNQEFSQSNAGKSWDFYDGSILCEIKDRMLLHYEYNMVYLCYDKSLPVEEMEGLEETLAKCSYYGVGKHKFSMIKKREFGDYELAEFKTKNIDVKIAENYNQDLIDLHPRIVEFIKSPDTNGIILLHGVPGTGKTSYIRNLIRECDTRFIFLPNNLFNHISEPDFIAFISAHPNTVIILEDCEELLKPREQNNSGNGISNLLNLGDGLLGDALKLKIICTFNCSLNRIDEAMLRKGRLMFRYEFKPLEDEKVNQLLKSLNIETETTEPMVLADVFHFAHNNGFVMENKAIGFVGG